MSAFEQGVIASFEKQAGLVSGAKRLARNAVIGGSLMGLGAGAHSAYPAAKAMYRTPGVQKMVSGARETAGLVANKLDQRIKRIPTFASGSSQGLARAYR